MGLKIRMIHVYNTAEKKTEHITGSCKILAPTKCFEGDDQLAGVIYQNTAKLHNLITETC